MKNNLAIINTGLDHVYLNGIPIEELSFTIDDIIKEVGRVTSLSVQADPYFNDKSNAQKLFSEIHSGDRTTMDFILRAAKDISPIFIPFQRQIPEGVPATKFVDYTLELGVDIFTWINPNSNSIFIKTIELIPVTGACDFYLTIDGVVAEFTEVGTSIVVSNTSNYNPINAIEFKPDYPPVGFEYKVIIHTVRYDVIGWVKALVACGDVKLPAYNDDIRISRLIKGYTWTTLNSLIKVNGATIKWNSGNAYVTITCNGVEGIEQYIDAAAYYENLTSVTDKITDIKVTLRDESDGFNYDLIINSELPAKIPSPRFEFNSDWNSGMIIYRYQNMDTRLPNMKLDYTSNTLRDIRVDDNTRIEVIAAIKNALWAFVIKELYLAVGYDKKAVYYIKEYEKYRRDAKFWLGCEKGYQTGYNFTGV
jgi:hypothetical protein